VIIKNQKIPTVPIKKPLLPAAISLTRVATMLLIPAAVTLAPVVAMSILAVVRYK
jgi:hypothetical protein